MAFQWFLVFLSSLSMVLIVLDHWLNNAMVLLDRCGLLSSVHDSISDSIIVLLIASYSIKSEGNLCWSQMPAKSNQRCFFTWLCAQDLWGTSWSPHLPWAWLPAWVSLQVIDAGDWLIDWLIAGALSACAAPAAQASVDVLPRLRIQTSSYKSCSLATRAPATSVLR